VTWRSPFYGSLSRGNDLLKFEDSSAVREKVARVVRPASRHLDLFLSLRRRLRHRSPPGDALVGWVPRHTHGRDHVRRVRWFAFKHTRPSHPSRKLLFTPRRASSRARRTTAIMQSLAFVGNTVGGGLSGRVAVSRRGGASLPARRVGFPRRVAPGAVTPVAQARRSRRVPQAVSDKRDELLADLASDRGSQVKVRYASAPATRASTSRDRRNAGSPRAGFASSRDDVTNAATRARSAPFGFPRRRARRPVAPGDGKNNRHPSAPPGPRSFSAPP
jgi:hypothetical protein